MDLTLDQLEVLDAIARSGSFAGAAARLHRVPSAISYTVRHLEQVTGLTLFDRSRRTAVLTPEGRRLLEAGRLVLSAAEDVAALARQLQGGWEPELRVVVDGALPMRPILGALAALHHPDIPTRVRLDVEHQEGVVERFENDRAHLMAVIGFAPDDDVSDYAAETLPDLDFVLVGRSAHPLAAAPTTAAASHHPELVVRDSSSRFAAAPKRSFLDSRNVIHLSDFHAKRLALLEGVGFGWIPLHLVDDDLRAGQLVELPLDGRNPRFTYHPKLVRRRAAPPGRAQTLLTDLLLGHHHNR